MTYTGKYLVMGSLISAIDDTWQPLPEPKRRCDLCITLLRRTNLDSLCSCCQRRVSDAQVAKDRGDHRAQREIAAEYAAQKARE